MKKLIIILTAFVVYANISVQAQDCLWAKSAGGNGSDSVYDICSDANENVFIIGKYSSSPITFGTTTLTNSGGRDIFIVKYNPEGTVLWARSIGGTEDEEGRSVSADASGSIYITGIFRSSTLTFGTITIAQTSAQNIFMAKYSSDGTALWAKSVNSSCCYHYGTDVKADTNGNVYFTGVFESPTITFDTTTLTNNINNQSNDIFLVKYSSDGTLIWAKSAGGTQDDYCTSISTDTKGNVYITGSFYGDSINFGTTTLTNTVTTGFTNDIFITKYAPDGTVLWAKSVIGSSWDGSNDVSTDASGNVYVIGGFSSDSISFGTTTLYNSDNWEIFIAKYAPDGTFLWAKASEGVSYYIASGLSISSDIFGNVFVTGLFNNPTITFETSTITNASNSGYYDDIFIAKYAPNGSVLWVKSVGNIKFDYGMGVSTDASGNVYVTGGFSSPTISFGTYTLTNSGAPEFDTDIFIAKYSGVSTGLNEAFTNNQLIISPNPTTSSITLNLLALKNSNISITTLTGTEVGNYNTQNTSTQTIDISHLANGVYFVSLKSEEGVLTKKIIKQ